MPLILKNKIIPMKLMQNFKNLDAEAGLRLCYENGFKDLTMVRVP
jgi:hypothetical protein